MSYIDYPPEWESKKYAEGDNLYCTLLDGDIKYRVLDYSFDQSQKGWTYKLKKQGAPDNEAFWMPQGYLKPWVDLLTGEDIEEDSSGDTMIVDAGEQNDEKVEEVSQSAVEGFLKNQETNSEKNRGL